MGGRVDISVAVERQCCNLDCSMRVKQIGWVNLRIGPKPDEKRFSVVILVKIESIAHC